MFIFSNLFIFTLAFGQVLTERMYGGKEAKPHSRPFMALVEMKMPDGKIKYCGGFLLNKYFVMTAAHCQASCYCVYLGLHNYDKKDENGVQIVSVEKTFIDKDYNSTSFRNDIMLLKLSTKAIFNEKVKPIALAGPRDRTPKLCSVSGWGRHSANPKYMSPVLLEANVTLTAETPCKDDHFYLSRGRSSPGQGDSGGPLVCENGKAYGVVSHGTEPDKGGVVMCRYAKISMKSVGSISARLLQENVQNVRNHKRFL